MYLYDVDMYYEDRYALYEDDAYFPYDDVYDDEWDDEDDEEDEDEEESDD